MTEPAYYNPETTPAVSLAGKLWPIPELAPRQLRLIRRDLIDITDLIQPRSAAPGDDADQRAVAVSTGERVMKLPNDQFGKMLDIVFHGLTRAHPALTKEEFDDWALADADVFAAFLIVRKQSGIYVEVKSGTKKAPTPGEVPAGS